MWLYRTEPSAYVPTALRSEFLLRETEILLKKIFYCIL